MKNERYEKKSELDSTPSCENEIEICYLELGPAIVGYCAGLFHASIYNQDVQELASETWHRAIKSWDKFKGKSTRKTWLCAIARNAYIDLYIRKSRPLYCSTHTMEMVPDIVAEPGQSMDVEILLNKLREVLSEEVLSAYYLRLSGYPIKEIARLCNKSTRSIENYLKQARDIIENL